MNNTYTLLNPQNVTVQDGNLIQQLHQLLHLGKLVKFYNAQNEAAGTWFDVFQNNELFYIVELIQSNQEELESEVELIFKKFYGLPAENKKDKTLTLFQLMEKVVQYADIVNNWYTDSLPFRFRPLGKQIENQIRRTITVQLKAQLVEAQTLYQQLTKGQYAALFSQKEWNNPFQKIALHPIWDLKRKSRSLSAPPAYEKKDLDLLFHIAWKIYQAFKQSITQIQLKLSEIFDRYTAGGVSDFSPIFGLIISFLKLLKFPQTQLNTFPKEHLDYYYKKVLALTSRKAIPDRCFIKALINPQSDYILIPKGHQLHASVDEEGLESNYELLQNLPVIGTEIDLIHTLYLNKTNSQSLESSYKIANYMMGQTYQSIDEMTSLFGDHLEVANLDEKKLDHEIGFVFSSPIFWLKEGLRTIDIELNFTHESYQMSANLINDLMELNDFGFDFFTQNIIKKGLILQISTAEGWHQIEHFEILASQSTNNPKFTIRIFLAHDAPAWIPLNEEIAGTFQVFPTIKILLARNEIIYLYSFLQYLELEKIHMEVDVKEVKNLVLSNNEGVIDGSKPFLPFGTEPHLKSNLLIGYDELFTKTIERLDLKISWYNLPEQEGGVKDYYAAYGSNIDTDSFKIKLSALSGGRFLPVNKEEQEEFSLFQLEPEQTDTVANLTSFDKVDLSKLAFKQDLSLLNEELPEYNNKVNIGYVKLELSSPKMGFGHQVFPKLYSEAATHNAVIQAQAWFNRKKEEPVPLPNEPYAPEAESITLNYKATQTIILGDSIDEPNFTHYTLTPFGIRENNNFGLCSLLPLFEATGYCMLGFKKLPINKNINIFIEFAAESDSLTAIKVKCKWVFLRENKWIPFPDKNIIQDTTFALKQTGIYTLQIPKEITKDNSTMPSDHYWIALSATGNLEALPAIKSIRLNCAEVQWIDNEDARHFENFSDLPKIKDFKPSISGINGVLQINDFRLGKAAEGNLAFYQRISNRLAHKQRPVTRGEIEKLVLNEFPNIQQVKCVQALTKNHQSKHKIVVTIIPFSETPRLMPKASPQLLAEVKNALSKYCTPFMEIEVINPVYEYLICNTTIYLKEAYHTQIGTIMAELMEALTNFFCPWMLGKSVIFGGKIDPQDTLNFVLNQVYVEEVSNLSFSHIYDKKTIDPFSNKNSYLQLDDTSNNNEGISILQASTPWSVLVPHPQQQIVLKTEKENILDQKENNHKWTIGTNYIISETQHQINKEDTSSESIEYFELNFD